MSQTATDAEEVAPAKSGGKGLLIGAVLGVLGGVGGFFVTYSDLLGLFPVPEVPTEIAGEDAGRMMAAAPAPQDLPPLAFISLGATNITLGPEARARLLRFNADLEVLPDHVDEVESLRPRIMDVLNTYLRAVSVADLENPAAMVRLRAQMLRRVQIVTGEGRVRDLLISEFTLN